MLFADWLGFHSKIIEFTIPWSDLDYKSYKYFCGRLSLYTIIALKYVYVFWSYQKNIIKGNLSYKTGSFLKFKCLDNKNKSIEIKSHELGLLDSV